MQLNLGPFGSYHIPFTGNFGEGGPSGGHRPREGNLPPPANDNSAAMAYMSDNNKTIALAQIMSMQMAMQQSSADRQMQLAAGLEQALEGLDTKLQIAKMDFVAQMTGEQNRNAEKLAEIDLKFQDLQKGRAEAYEGIPAPSFDDFLA